MQSLELSANLLECYIVTNNKNSYALFDLETGKQCSEFYSLEQWENLNEAEIILNYLEY